MLLKTKDLYENWSILPELSEDVYRNIYDYQNKDSRIKSIININYENELYRQLRYEVSKFIIEGESGNNDFTENVLNVLKNDFDEYNNIEITEDYIDYRNLIKVILNSPKRLLNEKFQVVTRILSYIFDKITNKYK